MIKLISKKRIGAARAAWSDSEKKIYINENWFKTAGNNELISVLTEEFGHFLDNSVNSFDTYGDEGYAFSQSNLRGKQLACTGKGGEYALFENILKAYCMVKYRYVLMCVNQ